MLEINYKKIYAALFLKQVPFSSYMKDGDFILKCQDNEIIVSDDDCYLNGEIDHFAKVGVRTVGFIKKGTVITSGDGSYENPYRIK